MKHANVSIFVPHLGCKNACSFCNQKMITGENKIPMPPDVHKAVRTAICSGKGGAERAEIAFFGGSFTAMDREYIRLLLKTAQEYVVKGHFQGIRISTRPDAIYPEILTFLKFYGVTSIELGAQSMRDDVLFANRRGHTAEQVRAASLQIKEHGFSLTLQMMTGLYKDDEEGALYTAGELIKLKPESVRIYPTVLLKGTYLERLYKEEIYQPQSLSCAVGLCAKLLELFERSGIPVIRLGLHALDQNSYISGPFHPAFRELCEGLLYYKQALRQIEKKNIPKGGLILAVHGRHVSKMIGQRRRNIVNLKQKGYNCKVVPDNSLEKYQVCIREQER